LNSTDVAPVAPKPADDESGHLPAPALKPNDAPSTPQMPRPEALVITDDERKLLGKVGDLITTPRTTKRLINTYRMLRVCAGDDAAERFSPEGDGEYQAVVVLLAVLLGCPGEAKDIFDRIMGGDPAADAWTLMRGPEKVSPDEAPDRAPDGAPDGASNLVPATAVGPHRQGELSLRRPRESGGPVERGDLPALDPLVSRFTYHLPAVVATDGALRLTTHSRQPGCRR
jgi:hypothetical protein